MITVTPIKKVTVTLTPEQLLRNYLSSWADVFYDNKDMGDQFINELNEVITLLTDTRFGNNLTKDTLRSFFKKEGLTESLIGKEAFESIKSPDVYREILVQIGEESESKFILIDHRDINTLHNPSLF